MIIAVSNRRKPRRQVPLGGPGTTRKPDKLSRPSPLTDEECSCGCGQNAVIQVHPDELVDVLDRNLTADDEWLMTQSFEAQTTGDAQSALDLYLLTPHIVDAPYERQLREVIELGDNGPSWVLNRWVLRQSYLWMLCKRDPRIDTAVCLTLAACYERDPDIDPATLYRLGTLVAASDAVCAELATHMLGGLADYVDAAIGQRLLTGCSMLQAWVDAALRPLRYEGKDCGDILATDLASGLQRRILDLGAMNDVEAGQHLLGRLVPIEQAPGLMFERRPMRVDRETAHDAAAMEAANQHARAPLPGWLCAVARGVRDGRLLPGAVGLVGDTPLTSDVRYEYGKPSPAA